MVGFTPQQQSALAQSLMQQGMQQPQGQMVGGHFVAPSLAQGLSNLASGFLGGRLQNIANQRQQQQQSELSQALLGGPQGMQERLAGLTDNPQAQQMMQQLALQEAMREPTVTPEILSGEQLPAGFAEGSVVQFTPGEGYEVLQKPAAPQKQPASIQEYEFARGQGYTGTFREFDEARKKAGATTVSNVVGGRGDPLTPAQEAIDKKFATEVYFPAGMKGGLADKQMQMAQLEEVKNRLLSGEENLTGPLLGMVPESLKSIFAPAAMDVQQLVEQTVQRSLRETLGAQFTEKEGERLISRAYNPKLSEEVNARRVGRLLDVIRNSYANQEQAMAYYEQNGTLRGYQGPKPAISAKDMFRQVESEFLQGLDDPVSDVEIPQGVDPQDWEFMTPEERALFQ
jgi:hypothetical protein